MFSPALFGVKDSGVYLYEMYVCVYKNLHLLFSPTHIWTCCHTWNSSDGKKSSGEWSKVNEKFVQGADPGTDSSSLRLSSIWQETINKYLWSGIKRNILLNISKHEASAVVTLLYYPSVSSHVIFYDENWFICDSGNFFTALGGCYFNSWDPSSRSVVCNPVINGSVRETSDMFSFLLPDFNKYCLWVLTICFQSSIKIVIVEQWFLVVVVVVFCCCCFLHFFQVSHLLK